MIQFLIIFLIIMGLIVFWSIKNGIGPVPSAPRAKKCLLAHLPKDVEGTIIEAGSGWGTLVFGLAKAYPEHVVIGYESSPIPFLVSKVLSWIFRYPNLQIVYADFWSKSFADAGLIVCYLYPKAMKRMKLKCEAEVRAGAWLISNTFSVPGWIPFEVLDVDDIYYTHVLIYKVSREKRD